ncbi:uncharacterized protein LOC132161850 [Corylus avellana]|uniref:uncharacterized protein LOC132161850 n=1 Tax=Corylus avellana TaxID=13451 RepID=UPI00286C0CA9|nr:uncharacterized protein LOC132161850 [Corylus avellana]XP_059428037.1 uncharacterized protein LOC132161850 [Corylus avellana]
MPIGFVRRVSWISWEDIRMAKNLIERCLQLYMNKKEVVKTLLDQAKIAPAITERVWQSLEKDNPEFFEAYYLRLMVIHQINEFNRLLQVQLMYRIIQIDQTRIIFGRFRGT